jgi:uridylate kinase
MDNKLPMLVFGAEGEDTIIRALGGERIGTLITAEPILDPREE